jgi:hypothetical protein
MAVLSLLAGVLAAGLVGCGAAEADYKVLENGVEIRGYSADELRHRVLEGHLSETSLIFDGGQWILFSEHPTTVELLESIGSAAPLENNFIPPVDPIVELVARSTGEELAIDSYLLAGKIMVFCFHSIESVPSKRFMPWLEKLAHGRSDVRVRLVEVERSGFGSIKWRMPLERPAALPHFMVFNPRGELVATGERARKIVIAFLQRRSGEGI